MNNLPRIEVVSQPKNEADLSLLLDEVRASKFIGEITPGEVQELIEAQTVRFFYEGEILTGFGGWIRMSAHWSEIGPFYTVEAYRGRGLGRMMFDTVIDTNTKARHKMYGVTKNPIMKSMFDKNGFRRIPFWAVPPEVQLHLLHKLTFGKLIQFMKKFSWREPVAHYIKIDHTGPNGK
jgi:GNAT superfamily N-acetyltransferase